MHGISLSRGMHARMTREEQLSQAIPASQGNRKEALLYFVRHAHMSRLWQQAEAGGAQLPGAALCRTS